ncbi:MAG: phage Gp37/Gp68 family protein [Clostridiaceae bacterium]|nr:phage Gp37/Gp68 family protein [Clostridiaceae bacterium]
MSTNSKIEWTQTTWNPITGCTPISAGCEHCYAATLAKRLKAMGNPRYKNGFQVTIHHDLFKTPFKWSKPRMIFVNSMSDLFHENIPDKDILSLFQTMNQTPWHTYQILTKRPDRLLELTNQINWSANIWMGVTVENNEFVSRCEDLKKCGAQVKFVSAEPLLTSLSDIKLNGINWLIVGGESGPKSRPIAEEWVLDLQEKAKKSSTAFFFKQWGGVNKKKTGSLLQGAEYKAYPQISKYAELISEEAK